MKKIIYLNIFLFFFLFISIPVNAKKIPNLIGKWQGENIQSTLKHGFIKSKNTVEITEQRNRLFRGYVVHKGGKEAFVGVITVSYTHLRAHET